MRFNRRKFLKRSGGLGVLGGLALAGCTTSTSSEEELEWTGRYVFEKNLGWASHRNLSSGRFSELYDEYKADGYVLIDVGANSDGRDVSYSMVWRENVDGRDWAENRNMDAGKIQQRHDQWTGEGMRPLTIEGYQRGGSQNYAAIWIENKEDLDWWADWDLTNDEFKDELEDLKADGYRPIDVETYQTDSGPRIAGVWWEDVDDVDWAHYRNMSREKYQQRSDDLRGKGYVKIDYESYVRNGDREYAAIWERTDDDPAFRTRTNRTHIPYTNYWRQYADEGFRIVDQEHYGDLYGGIWIENADRYRYSRKGDLDEEIDEYQSSDEYDVPGISAAIIQDGEMLYRRGFGWADKDAGRKAHGRTVYNTASVSKVIGGTLAARLEAEGELQDGTSVDLNMTEKVSKYLSDPEVPGKPDAGIGGIHEDHDYKVEELFAHLACVPHYKDKTDPFVSGTSDHFDTATEAAAEFWDLGLVDDRSPNSSGTDSCTVGDDRTYSSYGFTIAGAVLEQVTGRPIAQLVEEEISEPYGLRSTRAMYASDELTPDAQRAVPYDKNNDPTSYYNNSWKVLGGGIESTAVDLAWFGWKVLDGQVVDETVRDDRLWSPVGDGCSSPQDADCGNGIAWDLSSEFIIDGSDEFVAQHGGSARGAGAHLAVVRDENLVIALLSNKRGKWHDLEWFAEKLANEVVA